MDARSIHYYGNYVTCSQTLHVSSATKTQFPIVESRFDIEHHRAGLCD